jgi:UDP-N-acetylglucosamine 2-epimerase (non-hydrolysing)
MTRSSPPEVLIVAGTRPEAIKLAPVYRALSRPAGTTRPRLLLTGQHRELLTGAFETFGLVPDEDLQIMQEGQSLHQVAVRCLEGMEGALERFRPDMILVQGDTASVFFAALAGYFGGIATGHVEAGLRSGDLRSPFPEEGFRRLTGVLADLHFAPTAGARDNLLAEGIPAERVHLTGNTVVDALLEISRRSERATHPVLQRLLETTDPFVLLTAHRRESFGDPLERIFTGVGRLLELRPDLQVLYPVHPNPEVRGAAERVFAGNDRVHLVDPLDYPDLVLALRGAALILTDSGGIQEEAPTFGTPLLVLREVTERPEGIEAGVARLVGSDPELLVRYALEDLSRPRRNRGGDPTLDPNGSAVPLDPDGGAPPLNPYGDGHASLRIAQAVEDHLRVPSGDPRAPESPAPLP